jgi:hypothetical protein
MMKRIVGILAVAALLAGLAAKPAAAQLHGNAVYPAMPGTGVTIAGDFAVTMNDDAKAAVGGETAYFAGGRVTLGLPMFSVWAGAGYVPIGVDNDDSEIAFGGGAGFHVLNAPLMPVSVSLQAGVGYLSETGESTLMVPVGALVVINLPTPGISFKPWIMPGIRWVRTSPDVGDSNSDIGFGASGGIMLGLPMGLGVHATLDWMTIGDPSAKPLYLSVGLFYKIGVPGLGM